MLLLMVEAERDEVGHARSELAVQQLLHGLIDELAVAGDFCNARTGDLAAFGAGMSIAERLVVGVEDVREGIVVGAVGGRVRPEDEGLEEPGHVGAMPFRGADVRHRLHRLVLGAQRSRQPLCQGAH